MLGLLASSVSAAADQSIKYLALGDSLAAGVTFDKKIGEGYSDLVAKHLEEKEMLQSYSKAFAVPGYKTANVLADLQEKAELQEAVKEANLITISAGANDLLKEAKVDVAKGTVAVDPANIKSTLGLIAQNYTEILKTIKELNPEVSVYVVGYYYPYPFLPEELKPQLIELTHVLNKTIQASSTSLGAHFVPVYEKFGDDTKQYVPNPEDIHPNLDGYKLMAEALLESIEKSIAVMTAADLPEGHFAEKELKLLMENGLMNVDENNHIYPDQVITRAEAAEILFKSIPMTLSIPENPGFTDVPETHPSYMAIAKLTEAGVFAKNKSFNPDAPLTRVQMAKIITLAFQLKGPETPLTFADVAASHWGNPYVNAVITSQVMSTYDNGKFGVNDSISRAQFAVDFVKAVEKSQ